MFLKFHQVVQVTAVEEVLVQLQMVAELRWITPMRATRRNFRKINPPAAVCTTAFFESLEAERQVLREVPVLVRW